MRCVDDPSAFCRSPSQEHSIEIYDEEEEQEVEEEEEDAVMELAPLFPGRRPSRDYIEPIVKPLLSLPPPPAGGQSLARRNSFDPAMLEEEQEGIAPDFMASLGKRVGPDNYLRPRFGPSDKELARTREAGSPSLARPGLQERRPSGVLPRGYQVINQRLQMKHDAGAHVPQPGKDERAKPAEVPMRGVKKATEQGPVVAQVEEEEYAYVRHKAIPLGQLEEQTSRGSLIPDSCFQFKDVAVVEDDDNDPYPINAEKERRCYLSSKQLMNFFAEQFYDLARRIGKGGLSSSAKLLPPSILCRGEVGVNIVI